MFFPRGALLQNFEVSKGREFDLDPSRRCPTNHGLAEGSNVDPCMRAPQHFGARHNFNWQRARDKEAKGVACALFTAAIRMALSLGIKFTLENLHSSRLWNFGPPGTPSHTTQKATPQGLVLECMKTLSSTFFVSSRIVEYFSVHSLFLLHVGVEA